MFIEIIAITAISSEAFKQITKRWKTTKNIDSNKKASLVNKESIQEDKTNDQQLPEKNTFRGKFQEKNANDMIAATLGLTISIAGSLIYIPLSFLSIPFFLYASRRIHKNTYDLLKKGKLGVDSVVTITIFGCALLRHFFVTSLIVFTYRVAIKLTTKISDNSRQKLIDSYGLHADYVWIIVDDAEVRIAFNELMVGHIVVLQAGEFIPADGTVIKGMASVDQHILTGEARPIEKGLNDKVYAATVLLSGRIFVKVEKAGDETTVAKITSILNTTMDYKSSVQLRAEKLSDNLVVPSLITGGVVCPVLGFASALAIINTHPKNKMMIIAPLTIMAYISVASRQGILVKDGRSLELLREVDTIVFDKTGTLTEEQPHVGNIYCLMDHNEDDVLQYAAAAEQKQNHPLAKAICQEAKDRHLILPDIEESEYKLGYGLIIAIDGKTVHVGSERFMMVENISVPHNIKQYQKTCHENGYTLVMVALDNSLIGAIELLPTIRPEVKTVIQHLKQRPNINTTYIISGDHEIPTKMLAGELGIDHYFSEVLPENKAAIIEK